MKELEIWINSLLRKKIEKINQIYIDDSIVKSEIDLMDLPKLKGSTVGSSYVSDSLLYRLHDVIRNQSCESPLWDAVLWYLAHPLPTRIANDLIDRGVSVIAMGFTRQVDEVQWRLATLIEEALYTLIRERYTDSKFSVSQFAIMLRLYNMRNDGVLDMLSYYETTSEEKRAIYLAAVRSAEEDGKE